MDMVIEVWTMAEVASTTTAKIGVLAMEDDNEKLLKPNN